MSNSKLNFKIILAWLISIGIPLLIYSIPTTELFTIQMRTFLTVTVCAILLIALNTIPTPIVTLLLPVSYIILGLTDSSTAWYPWTMPTVWMIIGALILVNALESSGILMRISYKIIQLTGGTYKGLIVGLAILGLILNIILFGNAYVILAGLAYGLCKALDLEKFSKEATGIFLAAAFGGIAPGLTCYGVNIIMMEGFGQEVVGASHIGWIDYTFFSLPEFVYYILAFALILIMFRAQRQVNSKEYVSNKLKELGVLKASEKKATIWIVVLLGYVIACGITGWDSTLAFVVIPAGMLLPGIGCGSEEDIKRLDFSFILFVASCMSIGIVAGSLGFGALVTELSAPIVASASGTVIIMAIYTINVILNFLLTPMAIMSGFTSTYAQIALNAGINPYVIYDVIQLGCDQILFPYEYALYMLYFSFGFIKMQDFIKYFGAKMVLATLVLAFVMVPFWKITGLFFV